MFTNKVVVVVVVVVVIVVVVVVIVMVVVEEWNKLNKHVVSVRTIDAYKRK